MECLTDDELVENMMSFEKNGGEFVTDTHKIRADNMVIVCRYGVSALTKFIGNVKQTHRHPTCFVDGFFAECLEKQDYQRDTLVICHTSYDCLEWKKSLTMWTKNVKCISRKNQLLRDTPITIVLAKLVDDHSLCGVYYRILAPHGYKHGLQCRYRYELSNQCASVNRFELRETLKRFSVIYTQTRQAPKGTVKNDDDFFCCICLETYEEMSQLIPCCHTLCFECLIHVNQNQCHLCRGQVYCRCAIYKNNPPPVAERLLCSLEKSIVFMSPSRRHHSFSEYAPFEKNKVRLLKSQDTNSDKYYCEWPVDEVTRFHGHAFVNMVFYLREKEKMPEAKVIQSICLHADTIHVFYKTPREKREWENLLTQ
jgi:hypothetical protein